MLEYRARERERNIKRGRKYFINKKRWDIGKRRRIATMSHFKNIGTVERNGNRQDIPLYIKLKRKNINDNLVYKK